MEYANADNTWPEGALDEIEQYRLDLERRIGKKIGDFEYPARRRAFRCSDVHAGHDTHTVPTWA